MPVKKATAQKATAKSATIMSAKRGDLIVIDSAEVGSPPREGEILEVIQGKVSVIYRIKRNDGRQTLITPALGAARKRSNPASVGEMDDSLQEAILRIGRSGSHPRAAPW